MQSPLIGAWKFYVEGADGWHGLWVFSETHYAGIFEQTNRNLAIQGDKPTEAKEAYGYRTVAGGGGHYTIDGNLLTLRPFQENNYPQSHTKFHEEKLAFRVTSCDFVDNLNSGLA